MSIEVESPYKDTPYEALSDPDLGALATSASRAEVERRWGELARKGMTSRAKAGFWSVLRSSAKRIGWDIFCAPLEKEDAGHDEAGVAPDLSFGQEFLLWSKVASNEGKAKDEAQDQGEDEGQGEGQDQKSPDLLYQKRDLSLSTLYDELEQPLKKVIFDV